MAGSGTTADALSLTIMSVPVADTAAPIPLGNEAKEIGVDPDGKDTGLEPYAIAWKVSSASAPLPAPLIGNPKGTGGQTPEAVPKSPAEKVMGSTTKSPGSTESRVRTPGSTA